MNNKMTLPIQLTPIPWSRYHLLNDNSGSKAAARPGTEGVLTQMHHGISQSCFTTASTPKFILTNTDIGFDDKGLWEGH